MNIGEANDVQTLLTYLLLNPHALDDEPARLATINLADRSNKTLGAGIGANDAAALWVDMLEGCDGCEECLRPIETVVVSESVL